MQKTVRSRVLAWVLSVMMLVAFMPTVATTVHGDSGEWSFDGSNGPNAKITASYTVPGESTVHFAVATVHAHDKTYDGEAYDDYDIDAWEPTGAVSTEVPWDDLRPVYVQFFNAGDLQHEISAPVDAGDYVAVFTAEAEGTDNAADALDYFTIKEADVQVTAPEGKVLRYNGTKQNLVNGGTTSNGELLYKVVDDNNDVVDGQESVTTPKAKEDGHYRVYYKVGGIDANHNIGEYADFTEAHCVDAYILGAEDWTYAVNDDETGFTATKYGQTLNAAVEAPDMVYTGEDYEPVINYDANWDDYGLHEVYVTYETAAGEELTEVPSEVGEYVAIFGIHGIDQPPFFVELAFEITAPNGYVVKFDAQGKAKPSAQIVRPNDTAMTPKTPEAEDYIFAGWYTKPDPADTDAPYDFSTPVTKNMTLYAKWVKKTEFCVVGLYAGGVGDDMYIDTTCITRLVVPKGGYLFGKTINGDWLVDNAVFTQMQNTFGGYVDLPGKYKEGYDFKGFFEKDAETSFDITQKITEDTALYGKWVKKTYTVDFNSNGVFALGNFATQTVEYGEKAAKPAVNPVAFGKTFVCWSEDPEADTPFDFSQKFEGDNADNITLYAIWEDAEYTVTFNAMEGDLPPGFTNPITVGFGDKIAEADVEAPVKDGYDFRGWYTEPVGGEVFDFNNDVIVGDTILYARWEKKADKTFTVTFDMNGVDAEAIADQTVVENDKAKTPTDPEVEGLFFTGWYTDAACTEANEFSFDTAITADTTLYAGWVAKREFCIVGLYAGGVGDDMYINTTLIARLVVPKNGYLFGATLTPDYVVDNTIFTQLKNTFGGYVDLPEQYKEGYNFKGFFEKDAETSFDLTQKITEDTALYGKWEKKTYTVNFDTQGAIILNDYDLEAQTVEYGGKATTPVEPITGQNYEFGGWYTDAACTDGNEFSFDTVITADTTLYAKFTPIEYTVTFNLMGAEGTIAPVKAGFGDSINEPAPPTRAGYEFNGWWTSPLAPYEGDVFDFNEDVIIGNTTLYALWTDDLCEVSFDLQGVEILNDEAVEPQFVEYEGVAKTPSIPAAMFPGLKFAGWYTDAACTDGNEFSFDTAITADTTLYAKWEKADPRKHIVTIYADSTNDATILAQVAVEHGKVLLDDEVIDAAGFDPTVYKKYIEGIFEDMETLREGYEFLGFFTADDEEFDLGTKITSDMSVYGHWAKQSFTVDFDLQGVEILNDEAVETQYVDYNGVAKTPSIPAALFPGLTFAGWYTDAACTDGNEFSFDTAITADTTLYAKWEAVDPEKHIVTIYADSTNDATILAQVAVEHGKVLLDDDVIDAAGFDPTVYKKYIEGIFEDMGTLREGYEFLGFFTADDEEFDLGTKITSDMSVYGHWAKKTYTVTYDLGGELVLNAEDYVIAPVVEYGDRALTPINPIALDCEFDGWYTTPAFTEKYDFGTVFEGNNAKDIVLYAKFTPIEYTVTFNLMGGEGTIDPVTAGFLETISEPLTPPTKAGYKFAGWWTSPLAPYEGEVFDFNTDVITDNTMLYALWVEDLCEVDFDLQGIEILNDEAVEPQFVEYEGVAKTPSIPAAMMPSLLFAGWYTDAACTDGNLYSFDTPVTDDITLYAKWIKAKPMTHIVTVYADSTNDATILAQIAVEHGKVILDKDVIDADDLDAKAYAKYIQSIFDDMDTLRDGYSFLGFYTADDEEFDLGTRITSDISIYGHWQPLQYGVKFMMGGYGKQVPGQKVAYGEYADRPEDPEQAGWVFDGWFTDDTFTELFDFETTEITEPTKIYAHWSEAAQDQDNNFHVKFFANDGFHQAAIKTVMVSGNDGERYVKDADLPESPTRPAYRFTGWYTADGTPWDTGDVVNADLSLYAGWEKLCVVEFYAEEGNDATIIDRVWVPKGEKIWTNMITPDIFVDPKVYDHEIIDQIFANLTNIRTGYKLEGFFTEDEQWFPLITTIEEDTILHAHWTAETCRVEFVMNGHGKKIPGQDVEYNGLVTEPSPAPTAAGYTFLGWYTDPDCTEGNNFDFSTKITDLDNTTFLYAKWHKTAYYTEPEPEEGLVYNGKSQELLEYPGEVEDGAGEWQYRLGNSGPYTDDFTDITAMAPGKYKVWYKLVGTDEYDSIDPDYFYVTIAKKPLKINWNMDKRYEYDADVHPDGDFYELDGVVAGDDVDFVPVFMPGYEESAPSDIGEYTVKVDKRFGNEDGLTGDEAEYYELSTAAKTSYDFEIYKKGTDAKDVIVEFNGGETGIGDYTKVYGTPDPDFAADVTNSGFEAGEEPTLDDLVITREEGEDVGTYDITISLKNTTAVKEKFKNYDITFVDGTLEITKASDTEYKTGAAPSAKDVTYNGKDQTVVYPGKLAEDYGDGTVIEYAISDRPDMPLEELDWSEDLPAEKDAGTYYVYSKITGGTNHEDTNFDVFEVTVDPKPIGATWQTDVFIFDGEKHISTLKANKDELAKGDTCTITVGTRQSTIGTHTATFWSVNNPNYVLKDSVKTTHKYEIIKPFTLLTVKEDPKSATQLKLSWLKVKGADRYVLYGSKCGTKYTPKKLATYGAGVTKCTRKNLKKNTKYKYYIKVYRDGQLLCTTRTSHAVTGGISKDGKTANVSKIVLDKYTLTISKGNTGGVSGYYYVAGKKLRLDKTHAAAFRFNTNNSRIATVSKYGTITAKKVGTCKIYVQAVNGLYKAITVNVVDR